MSSLAIAETQNLGSVMQKAAESIGRACIESANKNTKGQIILSFNMHHESSAKTEV